jgi:cell division protein FtsI/penicillin-binding protein 2
MDFATHGGAAVGVTGFAHHPVIVLVIAVENGAVGRGGVAVAMGFFHLSHFAAHYRELFGESPSVTPRVIG